jgi:imidazolonepropionase-like amidohydrolase
MRLLTISAGVVLGVTFLTGQMPEVITVRAARVIDGRGQTASNQTVSVRGSKIDRVESSSGAVTHDLGQLTLLPGFIDTHVHIGWHFGPDGRYVSGREPADEAALYGAENAYVTLLAGFTTVQSVGSASDKPLRDAIARGILPGPRILTSLGSIGNAKLTADQIREEVRKKKAEGADLIKIFASASIRDGGTPTLSQEQVDAACGEARAQGLRSMVHAHSAEAMMRAARANCTVVEHGALATPEAFKLMAERGTWFDPNIGLVTQNYLHGRRVCRDGEGACVEKRDVRRRAEDAGTEDGHGHRRRCRRARSQYQRGARAHQRRPAADGGDRRPDVSSR